MARCGNANDRNGANVIVTLKRDAPAPYPYNTMGVLAVNGRTFQTVELPENLPAWYAGTVGKSCIPRGTYRMEARFTEARGWHYILSNPALKLWRLPSDIPPGTVGHSLVLIHSANWAHELLACIAPGKARAKSVMYADAWGVTDSRNALNEIRLIVGMSIDNQLIVS